MHKHKTFTPLLTTKEENTDITYKLQNIMAYMRKKVGAN